MCTKHVNQTYQICRCRGPKDHRLILRCLPKITAWPFLLTGGEARVQEENNRPSKGYLQSYIYI